MTEMSVTPSSEGVDVSAEPGHLQIDWGYWDAQLDTLEALESGKHDVVVYRGGYGSGKTVTGARWIITVAVDVPHSDNLVLAQDMSKGGPTTYKGLFKQLPGADTVPDEGGDPENSPLVTDYNRNKNRLTLYNGSVIRLGSADKWNRYAGGEFNAIWADEIAHYENTDLYKLNEMLISRQRTPEGPNVSLWTSTGNGYNQFYDFVSRQVDPDGEPLTTRIHNVVANSLNNPFLSEKDKLKRQFEGTSREEEALAGGFAAAEGLVYKRFSREDHVISEERSAVLTTSEDRLLGYDAGWDDPRVVVECTRTDYGQLLVLDLYYERESQPEDVVTWLKDNHKPRGPMYCEHEPGHIKRFRDAGWPAGKAVKDLDEGIPHVRGLLRKDHEGRPGLLVSQRCTPLIQEFLSYKEEHVGKKMAEDHCLDALRYAAYTHDVVSGNTGGEANFRIR